MLLTSCATTPPPATGALRPESHAGFRAGTWRELDQTIHRSIADAVIGGAVLIVARDGVIAYELAIGDRDPWDLTAQPMMADAIFDTASLAKPIATVTAAAFAAREGLIDPVALLDDDYSLDDLLLHRAGIQENIDWRDIAQQSDNRPARAILLAAMSNRQPAGVARYSNAGYLLAGAFIEDITNERLSDYLGPRAWQPLGMLDTAFDLSEAQHARVAPSADDIAPGQAFDPLADFWLKAIDRDPGHSGLFATGPDLVEWSNAMMRALDDAGDPLHDVARFVIGDAVEMRDESGRRVRRTRGFLVREDDSLFGPILEQTGFTGCALWLDPRRDLCIVLLTCGADGQSPRWRRMADDVLRTARIGARHGR